MISHEYLLTNRVNSATEPTNPLSQTLEIPDYQRELAWNFDKMLKLWKDIFRHLQITQNLSEDPFFLGNITLNYNENTLQLVDGQQRMTTLHIISSAIRDALITSGHQEYGFQIQKNLIIKDFTNNPPEPLLLPKANPVLTPALDETLSSRRKLEPYHKLIVPVDTGCIINNDTNLTASTDINVNIDVSKMYLWSSPMLEKHILIRRDEEFITDCKILWKMTHQMVHSSPVGVSLTLHSFADFELKVGDQIWLKQDAIWWHEHKEHKFDKKFYHKDWNTMFSLDFRKLYIRVRGDIEHYIKNEKIFKNTSKKTISTTDFFQKSFPPENNLLSPIIHFYGEKIEVLDSSNTSVEFLHVNKKQKLDMTETNAKRKYYERIPRLLTLEGLQPFTSGITELTGDHKIKIPFENRYSSIRLNENERLQAVYQLITDINFVSVTFSGPPKNAIGYFLDVNDPSKHSPLKTYDLINGLIEKISSSENHSHNSPGYKLVQSWEMIRRNIYLTHDKDSSCAEKFFYNYLMASKRWDKNKRYEENNTYLGLSTNWENSGKLRKPDGSYNLNYLQKEFKEMEEYSIIFNEIMSPRVIDCSLPGAAINPTPEIQSKIRRKQYLFILGKAKDAQWISPYMALCYWLNKKNISLKEKHLEHFLKDHITLILKYGNLWNSILKPATANGTMYQCAYCTGTDDHQKSFYQSNAYFDTIVGLNKYIDTVHKKISSKSIGDSLNNSEIKDLVYYLRYAKFYEKAIGNRNFYSIGNIHLNHVKRGNILFLLFAYESTLDSNDPIHWSERIEIEHILPQKPKYWGRPWFNAGNVRPDHTTYKDYLGNQMLIEVAINRHVSNQPLDSKQKKSDCHSDFYYPMVDSLGAPTTSCRDGKHYDASNFQSVKDFSATTSWTKSDIEDRTQKIMDAIITEFNDF